MSPRLALLALAFCLAPAIVLGQFGRPGDIFFLHHPAGAGSTFTTTVNTQVGTPARLPTPGETLEGGTNYTWVFSADTEWSPDNWLVFTTPAYVPAVGKVAADQVLADISVPFGPWPGPDALNAGKGFTLNFVLSTRLIGQKIRIDSISRPNEGWTFDIVAQAAPFTPPTTAAPTADTFVCNNNFARGGDLFVLSHGAAAGPYSIVINGAAPIVAGTAAANGFTLEGGTNYTWIFAAGTDWAANPIVFTSTAAGGAASVAIPNIPLGPHPPTNLPGSSFSFVLPAALIGGTLFVQSSTRQNEGFAFKIVHQVPPFIGSAGPVFQDPAAYPAAQVEGQAAPPYTQCVFTPVAAPPAATGTATGTGTAPATGAATTSRNGVESAATPFAVATIVAVSMAVFATSKYF